MKRRRRADGEHIAVATPARASIPARLSWAAAGLDDEGRAAMFSADFSAGEIRRRGIENISLTMKILTAILTLATLSSSAAAMKQKPSPRARYATSLPDLSQLRELQQALARQAVPAPPGNVTGVSATRQGPCTCANGVCACCSRILLNVWRQKACVNVTYDPDEFAFTAKVSMNDRLLYTRTVSGKNPRPVCVPMPRLTFVRACVRFYNIYFQGRNVHACVNMEGKFQDTTLFKVGMDCLRLGANGVALVKPEDGGGLGQIEILPEDPNGGEEEEDYDDYDDYDDGDDDGDLFDY